MLWSKNKQQLNATLLGKEDDAIMPFFNWNFILKIKVDSK